MDRPVIRIQVGALPRMVRDAFAALSADPDLFQRVGVLVTIAREPQRPEAEPRRRGVALPPNTPKIAAMHYPTLLERAATFAEWEVYSQRRDTYVRANPDRTVVSVLLDRPEKPGIRVLDSIMEAPFLRPDGTIVQQAGYDPATACLYLPSDDFPPISEHPTRSDAEAALIELREPFADFPFRAGADRDVPIAAVLTLLARPAIDGSVPLFLFDASTRGSGKSLLTDCIATIVTGRAAPRMSMPADPDGL
jgi:putative DNA primase/helicase